MVVQFQGIDISVKQFLQASTRKVRSGRVWYSGACRLGCLKCFVVDR